MPIYLANCTRQTMRFSYRVPGIHQILWSLIPSGRQEQLDKDIKFTSEQVASIVEQMERYGARESSIINRKMANFDGLLYSLNKPIPKPDFNVANTALLHKQEVRSATEAVNSVMAFDSGTVDKKSKRRSAKSTAIEVVQDVAPGERATGDEVRMNVEVSPHGSDEITIQ